VVVIRAQKNRGSELTQPSSAHGLRKATAVALAEFGAIPHMAQSLTGHRTLHEVENCTRAEREALPGDDARKLLKNKNRSYFAGGYSHWRKICLKIRAAFCWWRPQPDSNLRLSAWRC
jgi:hypothetical protein